MKNNQEIELLLFVWSLWNIFLEKSKRYVDAGNIDGKKSKYSWLNLLFRCTCCCQDGQNKMIGSQKNNKATYSGKIL